MIKARTAKFQIGQIVRHRVFSFRGVIFDIDPEFNNTEEWWLSIPEELRPTSPNRTCCPTIPANRSGIRRSPRFL
jgi:heat shock protein HspQ